MPSADVHYILHNNHHRLRFIFQAGDRLSHPWFQRASQVALIVKSLPAKAGDLRDTGLIPGLGKSPGGGNGNPFQHSCLENPRDRGAWWAAVYGVAQSWTQLKRLSMHACIKAISGEGNGNPLQCSCLENPRDGEPVGLPSMGLHRVRHD